MNKNFASIVLPAIVAAATLLPVVASNAQTTPKMTVNQRFHNQHKRIVQGERSGELTRGETRKVESADARIHRSVVRDRAHNGGKLTGTERTNINKRLNANSKHIYRAKHNNAVRNF